MNISRIEARKKGIYAETEENFIETGNRRF